MKAAGGTRSRASAMAGRAVPGEPPAGTSAHGPSSDAAPFSTVWIFAAVHPFAIVAVNELLV